MDDQDNPKRKAVDDLKKIFNIEDETRKSSDEQVNTDQKGQPYRSKQYVRKEAAESSEVKKNPTFDDSKPEILAPLGESYKLKQKDEVEKKLSYVIVPFDCCRRCGAIPDPDKQSTTEKDDDLDDDEWKDTVSTTSTVSDTRKSRKEALAAMTRKTDKGYTPKTPTHIEVVDEEDELEARIPNDYLLDRDAEEVFELEIREVVGSDKIADIRAKAVEAIREFRFSFNFLSYYDIVGFELEGGRTSLAVKYHYSFFMTRNTYLYLATVPLPIELFVAYADGVCRLLGKAELYMVKALTKHGQYQDSTLDINNLDMAICNPNVQSASFGRVTVRYAFQGKPEIFKKAKPTANLSNPLKLMGNGEIGRFADRRDVEVQVDHNVDHLNLPKISESETRIFNEGLRLVLVRNKALRTSQNEITNELRERTTWMHEELKWRLTLQEHAILSGKDPNVVKWRQWKDDNTANVKYRGLTNEEFVKSSNADFTVIIESFRINPYNRIVSDDDIKRIFVEFSFLQYSGSNLETETLMIPFDDAPLTYNFRKSFHIPQTSKDAKLLAEQIKNKENIVFTVVSEPDEIPQMVQSCIELGSCHVSLFDLAQSHTDSVSEVYPVWDEYNNTTQIGKLKVSFKGVLSVRSLALHILTPESFKILR